MKTPGAWRFATKAEKSPSHSECCEHSILHTLYNKATAHHLCQEGEFDTAEKTLRHVMAEMAKINDDHMLLSFALSSLAILLYTRPSHYTTPQISFFDKLRCRADNGVKLTRVNFLRNERAAVKLCKIIAWAIVTSQRVHMFMPSHVATRVARERNAAWTDTPPSPNSPTAISTRDASSLEERCC
jgi:hypothetical protein